MRATKLFLTPLIAAIIAVAPGCSKKETPAVIPSESQLLAEPLLLKLPESSAGFAIFDLGGEGYKRLKNSPYASSTNARQVSQEIQEALRERGADESVIALIQKVFDACTRMGIVGSDGTYTPEKVVSKAVAFMGNTTSPQMPAELGLFVQAARDVDLSVHVKSLQTALGESGISMSQQAATQGDLFSIDIAHSQAKIFVGATKSLLGVSTSQSAVEGLLSNKSTTTLTKLSELAEYKQSAARLAKTEAPLAFAFASLSKLQPLLESYTNDSSEAKAALKELPVSGVAMASGFPKEYVHNFGLAITPRTERQGKVIKALEESALSPKSSGLPADTAIALSIDPRFLNVLESFTDALRSSNNAKLAALVEQIRGLSIGMRVSSAGAPIPDVLASVESASRDVISSTLESSLGSLLSFTGQPASWQTKEIAGNQTRFLSTIIGAGVYLSSPKNSNKLLLGTSEGAVRDMSASQSEQAPILLQNISSSVYDQLASANVALFYTNFLRVADLLDSVKSTLAMFTGGNSELNDLLNSSSMKTWGIAAGSVSYTPGSLLINSCIKPPGA